MLKGPPVIPPPISLLGTGEAWTALRDHRRRKSRSHQFNDHRTHVKWPLPVVGKLIAPELPIVLDQEHEGDVCGIDFRYKDVVKSGNFPLLADFAEAGSADPVAIG